MLQLVKFLMALRLGANTRYRRPLLPLALAFLLEVILASETSRAFELTLPSGPYAAGFGTSSVRSRPRPLNHDSEKDSKGVESAAALRTIQILKWYPASVNNGAHLTVGDYLALGTPTGKPGGSIDEESEREWRDGLGAAVDDALWATRDPRPVNERFPVIIYAPSFSAPAWENADLCEFLATHGYIVLASASKGRGDGKMSRDLEGINAQAQDISSLITYATTLKNANPTAIAVMGFSWGGLSNLVAAAHDDRIAALIGLDGSLRYFPGLVSEEHVDLSRMTIPLLYFSQGNFSLEDAARYTTAAERDGENVLNAWTHGPLIAIRMVGMIHTEFSSMLQRRGDVWRNPAKYNERFEAGYTSEDGISGYAWVAQYIWQFLDAYLKKDARSMDYLNRSPSENGAPEHFMSWMLTRPADGTRTH